MKHHRLGHLPRHLSVDELRPSINLAGYWRFRRAISFDYRLPYHHLILVETGRIEARTPDDAFVAVAGDLICFRPAEHNHYGTSGDTIFYQAQVSFAPPPRHRLTPFFEGLGPLPMCVSMGDAAREARAVFETLCQEIRSPGVVAKLKLRAALHELLVLVARRMAPATPKTTALDPWLRLQQRLEAGLSEEVRVEDLARQMGLTTEYFIRQFKRRFGMSPKACHTRARLREAVRWLRTGDRSIKDVAYALGFSDPKAFARRFKHHLGVNPSDLWLTSKGAEIQVAEPARRLFPMNQHLLPPQLGPNWFKPFVPKGAKTPLGESREHAQEKIRFPERWA